MERMSIMITYFKMKRREWKIKRRFYDVIISFMDNQKEVVLVLSRLFMALKDVPVDDMQKEFISKLAEIIHNDNKNE